MNIVEKWSEGYVETLNWYAVGLATENIAVEYSHGDSEGVHRWQWVNSAGHACEVATWDSDAVGIYGETIDEDGDKYITYIFATPDDLAEVLKKI